jgi:hypothetical protein
MRVICKYSSLSFNCEHFPASLERGETSHPIFHIPQHKLLSFLGKWSSQGLTPTDSYLLFLAILRSSDQIHFRCAARRGPQTDAIIAQNMEYLAKTIIKLNSISSPSQHFPSFAIGPETADLSNVHYWIQAWEEEYNQFQSGYVSRVTQRKLETREQALERLVKSPHTNSLAFARQISEWAAVAGAFPTFAIKSPFTGLPQSCSDYWKLLIQKAAGEISLHTIPQSDLQELLEHCEDSIDAGSIYAHSLFQFLRTAIQKQNNFLGFGDKDFSPTISFSILDSEDVEAANMRAAIASAPTSFPLREQYPTQFAYMRARLKWDMAQKYSKQNTAAQSGDSQ